MQFIIFYRHITYLYHVLALHNSFYSVAMTQQSEQLDALTVIYDSLYVHCHASQQARLTLKREMDS